MTRRYHLTEPGSIERCYYDLVAYTQSCKAPPFDQLPADGAAVGQGPAVLPSPFRRYDAGIQYGRIVMEWPSVLPQLLAELVGPENYYRRTVCHGSRLQHAVHQLLQYRHNLEDDPVFSDVPYGGIPRWYLYNAVRCMLSVRQPALGGDRYNTVGGGLDHQFLPLGWQQAVGASWRDRELQELVS